MTRFFIENGPCGVETAFSVIGGKWTPWIIHVCGTNKNASFSVFKNNITGISDAALSRALNNLYQNGMLIKDFDDAGKRIYKITDKTKDIIEVICLMQKLASRFDYDRSQYPSTVHFVKKIMGRKWVARILWILYHTNVIRYNELHDSIEGISHKILAEQLNSLIDIGLVSRYDHNEKSPKVEYSLTEMGNEAYYITNVLSEWCKKNGLLNVKMTISASQKG